MKSLKESLFDKDLVQKDILYHPRTKNELIHCIKEQLELQGPNANLNIIDVSKITDMYYLFGRMNIRNIDISNWNVSGVENMSYMFYKCHSFNSDLSKWDVSNVKNMDCTFYDCNSFNSDLSKWNVSNVKDMNYTFCDCNSFNSDLSKWDVSNVKNMDCMFFGCKSFNSDLSKWDVSKVKYMNYMFYHCTLFNSDLSKWNVSKVKDIDMRNMLCGCKSFKKIPNWYHENLKESLFESIFGNNVKSDIVYHGEKVDEKVWKECARMFDWFRENIIKDQKKVTIPLQSTELDFNVVYNEDDCVLMVDDPDRISIVCPETIWFNYVKGSLKKIQTSGEELINNPRNTIYCISFARRKGKFYGLEYQPKYYEGYMPTTISNKAKKIIENY